jgi:hypothetical protein
MKSGRWAIIGMGVFITTGVFAFTQFGRAADPDGGQAVANAASEFEAQSAEGFRWTGRLASGQVEVKGINGDIRVSRADGSEIELVAQAKGRKSDPSTVRVERIEHAGGITFCAVYPTPEGEDANVCAPGSGGRMNTHRNDVAVDFELRLPADLDFVGRTVNGEIEADNLGADVMAQTVNGDVEISTAGFAQAETVNGSIDVSMGASDFSRGAEFSTVNGSITLDVDDAVNANLDASWLNGGFESDLPFTLDGRLGKRSARGVLGDGGPELELKTVNGSIRIR